MAFLAVSTSLRGEGGGGCNPLNHPPGSTPIAGIKLKRKS